MIILRESLENYNIKTRIGPLLFDIVMDDSFRYATAPSLFNRHNHASYEIHFIVEGEGSLTLDSEQIPIQANYYYFIPPRVYHSIIPKTATSLRKYTIRFQFTELNEHDLYFPANEIQALKKTLSNMTQCSSAEQSDNLLLLHQINMELEQQSLGYYAKLQALFNQLLINVLRTSSPDTTNNMPYQMPRRLSFDKRSNIIENFFDQYQKDLMLETLAELLNLSPRQTNRILQSMYQLSFRQKLIDVRIEESKVRLENTNDSIMMIAEQTGFKSYILFQTMFKQKTSMTAQAYRKRCRT